MRLGGVRLPKLSNKTSSSAPESLQRMWPELDRTSSETEQADLTLQKCQRQTKASIQTFFLPWFVLDHGMEQQTSGGCSLLERAETDLLLQLVCSLSKGQRADPNTSFLSHYSTRSSAQIHTDLFAKSRLSVCQTQRMTQSCKSTKERDSYTHVWLPTNLEGGEFTKAESCRQRGFHERARRSEASRPCVVNKCAKIRMTTGPKGTQFNSTTSTEMSSLIKLQSNSNLSLIWTLTWTLDPLRVWADNESNTGRRTRFIEQNNRKSSSSRRIIWDRHDMGQNLHNKWTSSKRGREETHSASFCWGYRREESESCGLRIRSFCDRKFFFLSEVTSGISW